ncbi:MAG TPA: hypothetical protein VM939_02140, partial [Gemmatimonadaceae bacterium]|nr:hypothetical protein [Gemmatimonadaceae bacterium]
SDPGVTAALRESSLHRSSLVHPVRSSGGLARILWPGVTLAALVVAAIGWWRASARPSPKPLTLAISTPPSAQLAVDPSFVLFAPDGQSIVYAASVGGIRKLFVRDIGNLPVAEIRGTDEARAPFFSPDGKWIAFGLETTGLYRVPAGGGNAVKIADAREYRGGTWSQTGDIVYSADGRLLRVPATGGTPEILTQPDSTKGERAHIQPMFLPDGETMVFRVEDVTSRANDRLAVVAIGEKSYRLLGVTGGNPLALIDGMLYFGRPGGFISVVPFDAGQRKVTGESAIAVEEVSVYAGAAASFAPDGSLVYVRSSNASALVMTDERGVELTSAGEEHRYFRPRLSPDGRTIAVGISSGGANRSDIWAYDVASKALTRITSQGTSEQPEWTPDGRYIVYLREFNGKFEIWRVPADGSGAEEKLFGGEQSVREAEISPDGKQLVLGVVSPRTGRDLLLLSLGSNNAKPFLVSGFNELSSRISPDNRWVTYISDESGRYEVYVRRLSGTGPRVQVSIGGGTEPLWTANGSRIVYRAGEKFVAAILTGGGEVSVSERRELFNDTYRSASMRSSYDVDRSGSRFVLLRQVGTSEIVVALNGIKQMLAATSRKR